MSEFSLNVRDFQAIGDGQSHKVKDVNAGNTRGVNLITFPLSGATPDDEVDWAAIQEAIETVAQTGGGAICIPPGVYVISRPIRITHDNVTLFGAGPASIIQNVGTAPSIFVSGNNNIATPGDFVTNTLSTGLLNIPTPGNDRSFTRIAHLQIDGTHRRRWDACSQEATDRQNALLRGTGPGPLTQHGIYCAWVNGLRLEGVNVIQHAGHGFYADNALYVNIDGCHFLQNTGHGIYVGDTAQSVTVGGSFRTHDNEGDGIRVAGTGQGRTILAGASEGNHGWGIYIGGDGNSYDTRVIGTYFESNWSGEIRIGNNADGTSLIGVVTVGGTSIYGCDPAVVHVPPSDVSLCLLIEAANRVSVTHSWFNRQMQIASGATNVLFAMNRNDYMPVIAEGATVSCDFDTFLPHVDASPMHVRGIRSISGSNRRAVNFVHRTVIPAGARPDPVTHGVDFGGYGGAEPDEDYEVFLSPNWPTEWSILAKDTSGFVVQFSPGPTENEASFGWLLLRGADHGS